MWFLLIANFFSVPHNGTSSVRNGKDTSMTSAGKTAGSIERSTLLRVACDKGMFTCRYDLIRRENEKHTLSLLHSRRLFPYGQRRVVAYAGMMYDADGKPRIGEMISRLEDLGVNCYSYLIDSHSREELSALPEFCELASRAGIEVWVVLVPPTEEPPLSPRSKDGVRYPPYGLDYLQWAKEISRISRKHHNLTLLMIDDFLYNTDLFTHNYVKGVYTNLKRENRNLLFGVTIYDDQLGARREIQPYLPYVDAVEWGYQHNARISPNYGISAASLASDIKHFVNMFPNALLIPCLYFTPHSSWSREATPSYLEEAMSIAYRQTGVVLVFRTPFRNTVHYELVKKFCKQHLSVHRR